MYVCTHANNHMHAHPEHEDTCVETQGVEHCVNLAYFTFIFARGISDLQWSLRLQCPRLSNLHNSDYSIGGKTGMNSIFPLSMAHSTNL